MTRPRSKTLATWLALAGGGFGLHRFYLHGRRDPWGWICPWAMGIGLVGLQRARAIGEDDRLAWMLLPLLGAMLVQGAIAAIVYGLTPDARWDDRFNGGRPSPPTRWGPVLGAITALFLGGVVLMSTIAFAGQRYFEWQAGG